MIVSGSSNLATTISMAWRGRACSELPVNSSSQTATALVQRRGEPHRPPRRRQPGLDLCLAGVLRLSDGWHPVLHRQRGQRWFPNLGFRDTIDGLWYNAVTTTIDFVNGSEGNTAVGSLVQSNSTDFGNNGTSTYRDYQGSWTAFMAGPGSAPGANLTSLLGSWGVDTANNAVGPWSTTTPSSPSFRNLARSPCWPPALPPSASPIAAARPRRPKFV